MKTSTGRLPVRIGSTAGSASLIAVAVGVAVLGALFFMAWASDFVVWQGERTIYTVNCVGGAWAGTHCSGRMVAAERYRFRALRPHAEVFFWVAGSKEPSGRYTECSITDGKNWSCKPNADAKRTIALQMVRGQPAPDPSGLVREFHAVPKWQWMLLNTGIPFGSDAEP